jgi:hypothetical protein
MRPVQRQTSPIGIARAALDLVLPYVATHQGTSAGALAEARDVEGEADGEVERPDGPGGGADAAIFPGLTIAWNTTGASIALVFPRVFGLRGELPPISSPERHVPEPDTHGI